MIPSLPHLALLAHTLFSLDKKATPEGAAEPFNRLRKDVMREAAALQPCHRVGLLAATSDPASLLGKDAAGTEDCWQPRRDAG